VEARRCYQVEIFWTVEEGEDLFEGTRHPLLAEETVHGHSIGLRSGTPRGDPGDWGEEKWRVEAEQGPRESCARRVEELG